jgi:aminoglycoside phosphotransferase (APT) family kinase protein
MLAQKFPDASDLFSFLLAHYERLHELIYSPSFTLTYNDFYWSNFVVRKDKKAAMMFDYNLMGRGYRSSDFRNVCSSLTEDTKSAFIEEYNRLFLEKHGRTRLEAEIAEKRIDDVAAPLFTLIEAYKELASFPDWAESEKEEVLNGSLLSKAKQLLM